MSVDEYDEPEPPDERPARRSVHAAAVFFSLVTSIVSGAVLAALVLTRDPGKQAEQLFAVLALCSAAGLGSAAVLAFGRRTASPVMDLLRALRRGALVGLACAGAVALQFSGAFTPANLAFLLLVLLIAEMIFVARRQNAP
ncbi:MAG: hypothetical protein JO247_22910 [Chloroflexi bacterium]|nr:hypothetical protein [Chloroflexota bacterium]